MIWIRMQRSELYRPGIALPLSDDAEAMLRSLDVEPTDDIRVLGIDRGLLSDLWGIGFFKRINESCHTMIDEFEDEFVEPGHLVAFRRAIDETATGTTPRSELAIFLLALREMTDLAATNGRPLLFVL